MPREDRKHQGTTSCRKIANNIAGFQRLKISHGDHLSDGFSKPLPFCGKFFVNPLPSKIPRKPLIPFRK
jgi:hypothetical protein